jgi:hypothetical protein
MNDGTIAGRKNVGALRLYLDFINQLPLREPK